MSGPDISRPSVPDPAPHHRWSWDPTLYAGSAAFYTHGRVAYPRELGERLAAALALDGSGRLLDVGCGPGSLAAHQAARVDTDSDEQLPHPRPPRAAITTLIQQYLGTARRAGRHVLPESATHRGGREEHIYRTAGFLGPHRIELPRRTVQRTTEEIRASIYSLSSAAPHLFGGHLDAFDAQLRALLDEAAADGLFSERMPEISIDVWR